MTGQGTIAVDYASAEPDAATRAHVSALAVRHAIALAGTITIVWYLAWFALPIDVAAWAGLFVFTGAFVLGVAFTRAMLMRQVNDEVRRRKELLAFAQKFKTQNSTQ